MWLASCVAVCTCMWAPVEVEASRTLELEKVSYLIGSAAEQQTL